MYQTPQEIKPFYLTIFPDPETKSTTP